MIEIQDVKNLSDFEKTKIIAENMFGEENVILDFHPFMGDFFSIKSKDYKTFHPYKDGTDSQDVQMHYMDQVSVMTDYHSIHINVFDVYKMELSSSELDAETLRRELADSVVLLILTLKELSND